MDAFHSSRLKTFPALCHGKAGVRFATDVWGRGAGTGREPSGPIHLLGKAKKSIPHVCCLLFYPVLFLKPHARALPASAKETIPTAHKSTIRKLFPRLKLKCFPSLVSCLSSQFPPCSNHQVSVSSQQLMVPVDIGCGVSVPHTKTLRRPLCHGYLKKTRGGTPWKWFVLTGG